MNKINIVYANMREAFFDVSGLDARVHWTRTPEPDADIIVYMNGYSFSAPVPREAFKILYTYEPPAVYPRNFLRGLWKHFDAIFTWSRKLADCGPPFHHLPSLYYDFPFGAVHGVTASPNLPVDWKSRKKAICQIAGFKRSLMPSALYGKRTEIAQWFFKNSAIPLDTYGTPVIPVPQHQGIAQNKLEVLRNYRFSLCLENDNHPVWCRGYITEKIFDCLYAFTVPIYLGDPDVTHTIPPECFIDLRDFDSLESLDKHLASMTDTEYAQRLDAIARFLQQYDAPKKHSCQRLYEKALACASNRPKQNQPLPDGLWQVADCQEKLCTAMMISAMPIYKQLFGTRYAGTT
jgi:hypothetical protein